MGCCGAGALGIPAYPHVSAVRRGCRLPWTGLAIGTKAASHGLRQPTISATCALLLNTVPPLSHSVPCASVPQSVLLALQIPCLLLRRTTALNVGFSNFSDESYCIRCCCPQSTHLLFPSDAIIIAARPACFCSQPVGPAPRPTFLCALRRDRPRTYQSYDVGSVPSSNEGTCTDRERERESLTP